MIRCFSSSKNVCAVTKKNGLPKAKGKNEFVCLFMEQPSEKEISQICAEFKFQKKYFLNYTKESRSLRYLMKPLVFVFLDYYLEDNRIKRTHALFAMKKNVLVVTIPHKSKYYTELFDTLALRVKEEKIKQNPLEYFLYYFLYDDARGNYDVIDQMEERVMDIEENVQKMEVKPKLIKEIVDLKRSCFRMSKHLWASAKLIYTIKRGLTPLVLDKELLILMDDVYDTLIHQIDLLTVQREILTDLLEIYATAINNNLAKISNELNAVMKRMTALTIIIMVPTLITSFYGMNFKYMPELNIPHASVTIWTLVFLSVVISYYLFHKIKWI